MNNQELKEILDIYDFNHSQYVGLRHISYGHINTTDVLYFDFGNKVKRYLLQKININVFKNPEQLMENIEQVANYGKNLLKSYGVCNYKNKILRIYKTKDKKNYVKTSFGNYYRIYHFIEGGISYLTSSNEELFYNAGKAIGFFQNLLAFYPAQKLYETIPHFHDTPYRYNVFLKKLNKADKRKKDQCQEEINFFIDNYAISKAIQPLIDKKIMPTRVTHNDTKLSNIIFDYNSNEGLCLIDYDTIMPGSICYDFGDFIRSGCNMGEEDSQDLSKVILNKDLFKTFAKGYLESVVSTITTIELTNLTMGAILMTYECGMRFLTDYLDGNKYFKTNYETHNLIRCKTQICMCKQLMQSKQELDESIIKIFYEIKERH